MKWYLKLAIILGSSLGLLLVLLAPVWAISTGPQVEQEESRVMPRPVADVASLLEATSVGTYMLYLPIMTTSVTPTTYITPTPTTGDIRIINIVYDPPTNSEDEYVDLQNFGSDAVDMTGWLLHDARPFTYTFPSFTLASGGSVRVWVITGTNTATELFWGRDTATFNNTGDTATLRDSNQNIIYTCTYTSGSSSPFTDC